MTVIMKQFGVYKPPLQFHKVKSFYIKRGCYTITLYSDTVIVVSLNKVRCWCESSQKNPLVR